MSRQHSLLVRLIAEAEACRLILESIILRGINGEALAQAIANRVAALEALAEHQGLQPTSAFAFVPPADKHVKHQRKNRRPSQPAA